MITSKHTAIIEINQLLSDVNETILDFVCDYVDDSNDHISDQAIDAIREIETLQASIRELLADRKVSKV